MNTWLSSNDPRRQGELERLAAVIEKQAADLRLRACGRRSCIAGFRFRLVQADRNTIYRVRGSYEWFLKMPKSGNREVVVRESSGAEGAEAGLAGADFYTLPAACAISMDEKYVLTAKIDGNLLNGPLYRSAFWRTTAPAELFFAAGHALARFHSVRWSSQTPFLVRTVPRSLQDLLAKATTKDALADRLESVIADFEPPSETSCLCHGNFGMENILGSQDKVTFIDFENCGVGSPYHDLAGLAAQLLSATLSPHLSATRIQRSLEAFLQGYAAVRNFDEAILQQVLALRLGVDYMRSYCCGRGIRTVCGIPVPRRRFASLVEQAIGNAV